MTMSYKRLMDENRELKLQNDAIHESLQNALSREYKLRQEVMAAVEIKGNFAIVSQRMESLNIELDKTKQQLKLCETELSKYKNIFNKGVAKLKETNPFKSQETFDDAVANQTKSKFNFWQKELKEAIREKDEQILQLKELIELQSQMKLLK